MITQESIHDVCHSFHGSVKNKRKLLETLVLIRLYNLKITQNSYRYKIIFVVNNFYFIWICQAMFLHTLSSEYTFCW